MRPLSSSLLLILVLTLLLAINSSNFTVKNAYACSCSPLGPEKSFENSDVVFSGKVSKVDEVHSFVEHEQYVSFSNVTAWKGVDTKSVTIRAEQWCGLNRFGEGRDYLVYANRAPLSIDAKPCSGTAPLENAQLHTQFLAGKQVVPLDEGNTYSLSQPFIIFGIALAAVGTLGFVSFKRLRRGPR